MDYFGDASGDLRGLLNGNCPVYVAAVVGGDSYSCARCTNKAVRQVTDLEEAKWNNLLDKRKRRLIECLAEQDHLQFGYALLTRDKLHSVEEYHHLYENVSFPPDWDLALEGYAYGEVLFEMGARDEQRPIFKFDRVSSKKQSEAVRDHVKTFVPDVNTFFQGSHQSKGIQAADCVAGAVAEDYKSDTDWLSEVSDERITECSSTALLQLEHSLDEYTTGP
jgi:hypothetical protein